MNETLRAHADAIIASSIEAVKPDAAVARALKDYRPRGGKTLLVAAGKAGWQMAAAARKVLPKLDGGVVVTKYGHVLGEIPGVVCCEGGHPVPDEGGFAGTRKALDNVSTQITGSVRELCRAAAEKCAQLGYTPLLLTDQLCCEAREAGSFLASIARSHAGSGRKLAYLAGGETVVHLTGKGKGGRNQELALAAAEGLDGLNACLFSVGSDGTDGPTDAAGGYVDGGTKDLLDAAGICIFDVLQNNDAFHALEKTGGLIFTGPTGTNVNDVAVLLIGE